MTQHSGRFLPYGRQVIEDDDVAAVERVLRSDYLTTGPEVPAFERELAARVGARHALACSSGTAALHLLACALGIGPGTAAIVPSMTFLATANAVRLAGGEVVFADVDPATGLMTPATAQAAFQRAKWPVKAVLPVHLGGQTADLPTIARIAGEHGAVVVEDACHAIGSAYFADGSWQGVGACKHSSACTFSLHPVKTIAAGEGGVVTCTDDDLAARVTLLRNHGMVREGRFSNADLAYASDGGVNPWYYEMPEPGFNYRMTDFQAALASSQLRKLDRFANVRSALVARYEERIATLALPIQPVARVPGCRPVWHLMQVLIDFPAIGLDRAAVMQRLRSRGIGTQVHYIPIHRQPYYASRYPSTNLPGADAFYARTLSLPLFADMSGADVNRVVDTLRDAIAGV